VISYCAVWRCQSPTSNLRLRRRPGITREQQFPLEPKKFRVQKPGPRSPSQFQRRGNSITTFRNLAVPQLHRREEAEKVSLVGAKGREPWTR
jgi:hypothetical protein